jgi:hypothetical protein
MTVTAMRNRVFTTVAIVGCLALVAAVVLLVWLWLSSGGGGGITSVGETAVQYVSINPDGRLSLVIWSDLQGKGGNTCRSGLFGSRCEGFFLSADARRIDWEWDAPKEKGGDFQINGTSYDLVNGTLFLVSTKGGKVRITQLDVDLSRVKPGKEGFEAFAKTEPRVAQFIAEASAQK